MQELQMRREKIDRLISTIKEIKSSDKQQVTCEMIRKEMTEMTEAERAAGSDVVRGERESDEEDATTNSRVCHKEHGQLKEVLQSEKGRGDAGGNRGGAPKRVSMKQPPFFFNNGIEIEENEGNMDAEVHENAERDAESDESDEQDNSEESEESEEELYVKNSFGRSEEGVEGELIRSKESPKQQKSASSHHSPHSHDSHSSDCRHHQVAVSTSPFVCQTTTNDTKTEQHTNSTSSFTFSSHSQSAAKINLLEQFTLSSIINPHMCSLPSSKSPHHRHYHYNFEQSERRLVSRRDPPEDSELDQDWSEMSEISEMSYLSDLDAMSEERETTVASEESKMSKATPPHLRGLEKGDPFKSLSPLTSLSSLTSLNSFDQHSIRRKSQIEQHKATRERGVVSAVKGWLVEEGDADGERVMAGWARMKSRVTAVECRVEKK
eukprot:GHVN01075520.1.p1 GENE.GHVN01075520.1~~GHVN01075520.1.p1  ORF type:complete len:436 (+),score=162.04 GHVN01075520.1:174-1481(+)